MEHLQQKMEEKRAKDAVEQKALDKAHEIARCESGQKQVETQTQMEAYKADAAQRKRDADDKAERMANKVGHGGGGGGVCSVLCCVSRRVVCTAWKSGAVDVIDPR
jgi:hypothetical protein